MKNESASRCQGIERKVEPRERSAMKVSKEIWETNELEKGMKEKKSFEQSTREAKSNDQESELQ